ncbi:MAG: hypothetical protein IPK92_13280 [Nitrospira sp.]|nr:hypothetical protein [Nitrospira sp.]MBL8053763.1 hypothetical protein [Nitrospira sp.]
MSMRWLPRPLTLAIALLAGAILHGESAHAVNIIPIDASSRVSVSKSGLTFNRVSQTFDTLMTVTNTSSSALTGPVVIVVETQPSSVTVANSTGTLFDGRTYISASLKDLAPGATISNIVVKFKNPTRATFSINTNTFVFTSPNGSIGGKGIVQTSGGTIASSLADVIVPPNSGLQSIQVTITPVTPVEGLPSGLTPLGLAADIKVTNQDLLNAPLLIKIKYDDSNFIDENNMAVAHYNASKSKYEPVTVLAQDTAANTITVESRTFSVFVLFSYISTGIPPTYTVPGFSPAANGWNIGNNFVNYFTSGGNCLGMSGYATWFFENRPDQLFGKFSAIGVPAGSPSIAQLVATRAHLAQSQYWAFKQSIYESQLGVSLTARLMKVYLSYFNQPLILLLSTNPNGSSPTHASVLYGYDASGFIFYDVNLMNASQYVTFNGSSWGTYGSYKGFTFVAMPSLGRTEDFAVLTAQAEGGFTASNAISVTSPTEGQVIPINSTNSTTLAGTLSGGLNAQAVLIAYVKGVQQIVPISSGTFSATIPVSSGDNTLILMAGVNIANQSNWYPNAATLIRNFRGGNPATKLLTTLTWNQNDIDVDLYVTDPNGQTAWYASKSTASGIELDFDNTTGFGPEHTTLVTGGISGTSGVVLPGNYIIRVHYYSDHATGQSATGTVSIVLNENAPNQQFVSRSFTISTSSPGNASPGGVGSDWVDIATVNLVNNTIQ